MHGETRAIRLVSEEVRAHWSSGWSWSWTAHARVCDAGRIFILIERYTVRKQEKYNSKALLGHKKLKSHKVIDFHTLGTTVEY